MGPTVARISCRYVSILVVDLGKVSLELIFFNSIVDIGVWARNDDAVWIVVAVGHLEVYLSIHFAVTLLAHTSGDASNSNLDLGDNLELLPIPEDEHPVWGTCQSDDELMFLLGVETSAKEFLRLVVVALDVLIWQNSLWLLLVDVIYSADGSVGLLTNGQILLRF